MKNTLHIKFLYLKTKSEFMSYNGIKEFNINKFPCYGTLACNTKLAGVMFQTRACCWVISEMHVKCSKQKALYSPCPPSVWIMVSSS